MHETHLIQPVIKGISEHTKKEGAKRVSKIRLKVGDFIGTNKDSFKETFSVLAKGTECEGAELELTFFPSSHVEVVSFDVE
ncbi:MAG: hypothetical protein GF375_07770 [Candidatus Omnitrophica bacterium]|nr:hypothetical protein [Candidatus Omnitrophota bacterium]MBD3269859.1 hypothetical protein [Candidatus Omnitrophota bacterium]